MDNRRIPFCGTPLSKSLNDRSNDEGPITARRARLNQQQTVKDAQGRQRFHGAFTGGFSAGYYNTVDTVEGFQPKQFITHRGQNKTGKGTSRFTHSAEDYMDDEDISEFGIAPRKIRVASKYSSIENFSKNSLFGTYPSQTKGLSVGQMILKNMVGNLNWLRELRMFSNGSNVISKSDFHGLGYKPLDSCLPSSLSRSVTTSSSRNPLTATLEKAGKRIKISGEAFGTGILEEDEEYLNNSDLYGYDDMSNYDFQAKSSSMLSSAQRGAKKASQQGRNELNFEDPSLLAGFELAEELYTMQLQHDGLDDEEYKLPNIPADWRMPSRDVPYIPPVDETATTSQKLKLIGHQSSSAFNKKFINASEKLLESSSEIGTKAGLLHYSDLKASVAPTKEEDPIVADAVKATITRVQFEWRPCSLLCKHFNVPNPYPGESFVGTKPVDQQRVLASEEVVDGGSVSGECEGEKTVACQDLASLALRQSIFNVIFQDDVQGNVESNQLVANYFNSGTTDSEDEPQIVGDKPIAGAPSVRREKEEKDERLNQDVDNNDDDDDQDIVIVTALRPEPEVIVLSSSSSSSRSSSSSDSRGRSRRLRKRRRRRHRSHSGGRSDRKISASERSGDEEELQIDTYGPPLPPPPGLAPPPTSSAASDLDSHRSDVRHRSSRRKKKSKSRRKKHKRHA